MRLRWGWTAELEDKHGKHVHDSMYIHHMYASHELGVYAYANIQLKQKRYMWKNYSKEGIN